MESSLQATSTAVPMDESTYGYAADSHRLASVNGEALAYSESRRSQASLMASIHQAVWWCGHIQSSFNGGPTLSAALMKRIGEIGVPLSIDDYHSSSE